MGVGSTMRVAARRGSALLAALCFVMVLTLAVGSYLRLCYTTLQMSSRDLAANRCLHLAESGLEEAFWALNHADWSGWKIVGSTATKDVGGFSYEGGVTGAAHIQVGSYNGSAGLRTVTVTGTLQLADGRTINRSLSVKSTKAPVFVNALAGTAGTVAFSSGGLVDSYDSAKGDYATQSPTFSATIASNAANVTAGSGSAISLMNAQVMGYAASSDLSGPSFSTSGRLAGPSTPTSTRVDTERMSSSPYQPVFPIKSVAGAGNVLAPPVVNSTTTLGQPTDTSPAVFYSTGLDLTGSTKIIIDGPVQLVVSGTFYIGLNGGMPSIEVTSQGRLEVFTTGDIAIYGGGINNLTRNPGRLAVYGTNTLTTPDLNTATPFHGVVYTPNGNFNILGNAQIYGSVVAKKISLSGAAPQVHYDVNLRKELFDGIDAPFAVSEWREIPGS